MDSQVPLLVKRTGNILTLSLNNTNKRNALNTEIMGAAAAALENITNYPEIRVVIIRGEGSVFCSGADVSNWKPNELQFLLTAIVDCSLPTIAAVHGACLGGGMGLACSCDFILAKKGTIFGFPEVRIGMVPAIISPYVYRKMQLSKMRELFLTGEKFGTKKALSFGLLYDKSVKDLDGAINNLISKISIGGPNAQTNIKKLLNSDLMFKDVEERNSDLATFISEIKEGVECQEGINSFLEKRKPSWSIDD